MTESEVQPPPEPPGMLFDLDGTLMDSVYQHLLTSQQALTMSGSTYQYGRFIAVSA